MIFWRNSQCHIVRDVLSTSALLFLKYLSFPNCVCVSSEIQKYEKNDIQCVALPVLKFSDSIIISAKTKLLMEVLHKSLRIFTLTG